MTRKHLNFADVMLPCNVSGDEGVAFKLGNVLASYFYHGAFGLRHADPQIPRPRTDSRVRDGVKKLGRITTL